MIIIKLVSFWFTFTFCMCQYIRKISWFRNSLPTYWINFLQYPLHLNTDQTHSRQQLNKDVKELRKESVDFLDITMDLQNDTFIKPNTVALYINCRNNHPPPALKNIPDASIKDCWKFLVMKLDSMQQSLPLITH